MYKTNVSHKIKSKNLRKASCTSAMFGSRLKTRNYTNTNILFEIKNRNKKKKHSYFSSVIQTIENVIFDKISHIKLCAHVMFKHHEYLMSSKGEKHAKEETWTVRRKNAPTAC